MKKLFLLFACFTIIFSSKSVNKYDWKEKATFPGIPRHRACGFAIGAKGYVGLGHINSGSLSVAYDDWWEFDPATNSWTQRANYPAGPRFGCYTFGFNNCAYVGGGAIQSWGAATELFKYDPTVNTWTYIGVSPVGGEGYPSFVAAGKGYVNGWEFDPVSNTWISKPAATVGYWDYVFVIKDTAYFKSGSTMVAYNPVSNTSISKTPCPDTQFGPSSFSLKGKGYVCMGTDYTTEFKFCYIYDPVTNLWDTIKSFPGSGRHYSPTFTIGDKAYLGTGSNGTNLADFWEYAWRDAGSTTTSTGDAIFSVNEISIFPQPAADYFLVSISSKTNSILNFKLFQIDGKEIFQTKINSNFSNKINCNNFEKGIYVAVITDENNTTIATKKIVLE